MPKKKKILLVIPKYETGFIIEKYLQKTLDLELIGTTNPASAIKYSKINKIDGIIVAGLFNHTYTTNKFYSHQHLANIPIWYYANNKFELSKISSYFTKNEYDRYSIPILLEFKDGAFRESIKSVLFENKNIEDTYLVAKDPNNCTTKINVKDICYINRFIHQCYIHTNFGVTFSKTGTLINLLKILDDSFSLLQNRIIINKKLLKEVSKTTILIGPYNLPNQYTAFKF